MQILDVVFTISSKGSLPQYTSLTFCVNSQEVFFLFVLERKKPKPKNQPGLMFCIFLFFRRPGNYTEAEYSTRFGVWSVDFLSLSDYLTASPEHRQ